jgi:hypothetical protein
MPHATLVDGTCNKPPAADLLRLWRIDDIPAENDGAWRHSAAKSLRQPTFRRALRPLRQL